ncbi:hypothetical protein [Mixta calida]|uniref:hypothetical protein n=1 Tax=Mixta calida TaxID=665913 RepID=UPI0034D467A3
MKNNSINIIYILALLASIAFPYALYLHHNNPKIEYVKPNYNNDIRYSIDLCKYDDNKLTVKGWAFPAKGQTGLLTRLYIENDNRIYPIYKKTIKTPDVMRIFGGGKRYAMVGFYGVRNIPLNKSQINLFISIEDTDGKIHETKYTCQ